jgi:uncharacterized phage protein (TIGR02218 family)
VNAPELLLTSHDQKITVGGYTFIPTSSFGGSAVSKREGMSVDNLTVSALSSDLLTEEDMVAGVYDDAEVHIYIAQWSDPSAGLFILKRGYLGEVKTTQGAFEVEVRGLAEALQRPQGDTYTLECNAHLGDSNCKVDVAPYTTDTVVSGVQDSRTFSVSASQYETYWQYGSITFTSGDNAGRSMEVLGHVKREGNDWIILTSKAPFSVSTGDTVSLVRGCDKTRARCKSFNNILNYQGFPDMPTEAVLLETPKAR